MSDKKLFKSLFIILLTLLFCSYTLETIAQKQVQKKAKSSTNKTQSNKASCPPKPLTVSFGVLNAKAINLVKPEYPSLARQANIYGRVVVNISVDEEGDVVSAKASSGHPLLYAASVKAALESKFEPIMLSGCPIKVLGSIYYNFLPLQWNWFEIGYALGNYGGGVYPFANVKDTLPLGYEEEKQLLKQAEENYEIRRSLTETVISSIKSKLLNNAKQAWLFSTGLATADVYEGGFDWNQNIQNLDALIQTAPKDVSETLLSELQKLTTLAKRKPFPMEEYWQTFREIEERLPITGK